MVQGNRPVDDDDGGTILDDGLSVCDEETQRRNPQITSAEADALRASAKSHRYFTIFLLFFTLLLSIGFASTRYFREFEDEKELLGGSVEGGLGGGGGSEKRDGENALRLRQTLDYLIAIDASNPSALQPANEYGMFGLSYSPQYLAAYWMATLDQRRLSVPSADDAGDYPFLQRYALAVLYFATGGLDYWKYNLKFLTGLHECNWFDQFIVGETANRINFGVICDGEPDVSFAWQDPWSTERTVTGVTVTPRNNVFGTLPDEVRHLRYLKTLVIHDNKGLMGTIPFQYGSLKHMSVLALYDNSLSGKIPREFGGLKKLEILSLQNNRLSADTVGGDLDFMQEMTSLTNVVLDYNLNITGTLPEIVISNLSNLKVLSLSNLGLFGTLPPGFSMLSDLRRLYLDDNDFEGSVDVIQNLTNLTHVYLEDNRFNDTLDDASFARLEELAHLDVSNCFFGGSVPGHLLAGSLLTVLDMSLNDLGGELPTEGLWNMDGPTNLRFLSLHSNNITGPIPASIGRLRNLTTLDLSINDLSGAIPPDLAGLADLEILFLGSNGFDAAPLPGWVRNMTRLAELSLKGSSLNGTIPAWLGELGGLTFLDLGGNDLGDTIPQELGNLTGLMVLLLNGNRLEGELGLGGLKNLEAVLVDDNALTGDTDAMCAHDITHFIADCAPGAAGVELNCTCCTLCCSDENSTCNDAEWLGNHRAMWEFGYERKYWDFDNAGLISPYIDYNNRV